MSENPLTHQKLAYQFMMGAPVKLCDEVNGTPGTLSHFSSSQNSRFMGTVIFVDGDLHMVN